MSGTRIKIEWTSTCAKRQHRSVTAAREHLLSVQAKNLVFGYMEWKRELGIYKCEKCGFYHVGHRYIN